MIDENFEIVIVDDEEWVRKGLISKLQKSGLPVTTLKDFVDGDSVLEYIEGGGRPHIILCDIRMPGTDGLSLASKVRSLLPGTRVIIVSGYGEFEYAKRAIQAQVSEYLLKPIDNFELFMAIKKCMEAISISHRNSELLAYLQDMERGNKARTFLGGSGGLEPNHNDLKDIFPGYRKGSNKFIAVYFRVRGIREEAFHDLVNEMGPGALDKELIDNSVLYSCVPGEYVLLFLAIKDSANIKEFAELLIHRLQNIREQGKDKENFSLPLYPTAGLSGIRDTADKAIMEALEMMKYRVLLEHSTVICENNISAHTDTYNVPGHCISALKHALAERNEKGIASVLNSVEANIRSLKISYHCLENAYLQLLMPVNEASSMTKNKNLFLPAKDAYYFINLANLFVFVKEAYSGYIKINSYPEGKAKSVSKEVIVKDIAASIKEHYDEYLTLELFADEYGINLSYLSIIFKEIMGCNFQKYLSKVRISNAKEFLTSGRYNVGEVAEKAGYTSRFYFSKAFKKIEGQTPSEFMSMKNK